MSRQPVRRRLLEADEGQSEDNAVQQTHADIAFSSDGKCNDGECDRERNPASSGQFDGSERVCELSEDGHSNGEFSEDECSNDEFSDDGCSNGEPSEVGCSDSELGGDALSDGKLSGGVLSDGDLSDNELVAAADVAQGEWYVLVKAPSRMTKVEGLAAAAAIGLPIPEGVKLPALKKLLIAWNHARPRPAPPCRKPRQKRKAGAAPGAPGTALSAVPAHLHQAIIDEVRASDGNKMKNASTKKWKKKTR